MGILWVTFCRKAIVIIITIVIIPLPRYCHILTLVCNLKLITITIIAIVITTITIIPLPPYHHVLTLKAFSR